MTGHTLLDAFVNSDEKEFYDIDAAKERANNIPVFKNGELDEKKLYNKLSAGMPELNTKDFDIKMPIKPGSIKVGEVWKLYFDDEDGYIANVKAQLVNKVKLEMAILEHEYLEKLSDNQLIWIKEQSKDIEDGIFGVFDDEHPDPHCSMKQAIEVAKQAEILASKQTKAVDDISITDDKGHTLNPLPVPKRYKKAYDTALLDKESTEKVILDKLDRKLRRHPVFMFSMFSRALLMGLLTGSLLIFINPFLSILALIIPIGCYFGAYRKYMNELKSLQERYIAMSIMQLNKKLRQEYRKVIHKSQSDITEYCKWNWEKRLSRLRDNLGVLMPKEFHFKPFEDFQPLVTDNLIIKTQNTIKNVAHQDDTPSDTPALSSGGFDGIPLLSAVPNFDVKLGDNPTHKSVTSLNNSEKMLLIHELMKQTADVPQQLEENLDPAKMILKTGGGNVTLMLDVSGSMCGEPIRQLKKALEKLTTKFGNNLRWIAFATQAKWDVDVNNDIDIAENRCGGGTSYVPAFDLLINASQNGDIKLGKVVIISDGEPCDVIESRNKVLELGCVVDVIYIGKGNKEYLEELAESTGGTLQQVDNVQEAQIETVVEDGIATGFKLSQSGNFPFGDLLRKSASRECMKALHIYSKRILKTNDVCIEQMITDMGNANGLRNWIEKRAETCTLNPGAVVGTEDVLIKSSGILQNQMLQKLQTATTRVNNDFAAKYKLVIPKERIGDSTYTPVSPDILLTQLHIQALNGINDLGWSIDPDNDRQIGNDERFDLLFKAYFGQNGYQFFNIYNRTIA